MYFLPKYLTIAVIGTVAVYVGAPYLRPYLPTDEAPPSDEAPTEPTWTQVAPPGDFAQDFTDDPPNGEPMQRPNDVTMQRPNDVTTQRPNDATTQRPNDATTPEVIVENVRGYTPSTERIRASGSDVTYWGVTIVDTPFYDRDGKLRDTKILGGTLIEQTGATRSSKGEMAICRIWRNGNWAGSYLISTADLIRFDGGREEVDADDVDLLCKYYNYSAAVERRKEELTQKAAAANPYFTELKRKATAYNEHKKRAEELTAKRDQAKGTERSSIIAELTKLKNAESREAAEVQSLTRKYEDWKKAHPSTVNPATDPKCKELLDKMAELKPKLSVFGL
jgi:hypothetical protein